jgi:hypothetical protein
METMRNGDCSALPIASEDRVRFGMTGSLQNCLPLRFGKSCIVGPIRTSSRAASHPSAALPGLLFFVLVNRNRIQVLCLKHLTTVKTPDIINAVAAVEKFGSLVLTTLHCANYLF